MLAAAAALDQIRTPSMLVGAFSASYHGIPRSTEDADFVLPVDELPITLLAAALGPNFKIDPQAKIETFTLGTYYTVAYLDSDFTVDLFLLKNDPHDQSAFTRRLFVSYGSHKVSLSTPEDLIITKLRWSQNGRRSKDIIDAKNVLAVQSPANLDLPYIRHWTDQHSTRELFEKLLKETPII